jgi:hypothetical protein
MTAAIKAATGVSVNRAMENPAKAIPTAAPTSKVHNTDLATTTRTDLETKDRMAALASKVDNTDLAMILTALATKAATNTNPNLTTMVLPRKTIPATVQRLEAAMTATDLVFKRDPADVVGAPTNTALATKVGTLMVPAMTLDTAATPAVLLIVTAVERRASNRVTEVARASKAMAVDSNREAMEGDRATTITKLCLRGSFFEIALSSRFYEVVNIKSIVKSPFKTYPPAIWSFEELSPKYNLYQM